MKTSSHRALDRMRAEKQSLLDQAGAIMDTAQSESRDMSRSEMDAVEKIKELVSDIVDQIQVIEPIVAAADDAEEGAEEMLSGAEVDSERKTVEKRRALGVQVREDFPYRSAGEFFVDYLAARGMPDHKQSGAILPPNREAADRLARAYSARDVQMNEDTPGLLPTPLVGPVLSLVDASRPFISSIGAKPFDPQQVQGTNYNRPKVVQNTEFAEQMAEGDDFIQSKMKVENINFVKRTFGGTAELTRQNLDWTSPAAWDLLMKDMSEQYAIMTETVVANAFADVAVDGVEVAAHDLGSWLRALNKAASAVYGAAKMMPDSLYLSLNVWAELTSLTDDKWPSFSPNPADITAGSASVTSFAGSVRTMPWVVVPSFPDDTCIMSVSSLYEFHEERLGPITLVSPTNMGITVGSGGYAAFGSMEPDAHVKITVPEWPDA